MLVTCDKCGKSFSINDEQLYDNGGKTPCPDCQNMIVAITEGAVQEAQSNVVSMPVKPQRQNIAIIGAATASDAENTAVADETGNVADTPIEPSTDEASTSVDAVDGSADAGSEGGDAPAENAEPEEVTWKIRLSGIPYTFHDLESLHDWLKGRMSIDGVKVAKNDDSWREIGDYPEVLPAELVTRFFPLGDVPKTPEGMEPAPVEDIKPATSTSESSSSSNEPISMGAVESTAKRPSKENASTARQEAVKKYEEGIGLKQKIIASVLIAVAIFTFLNAIGVINLFGSDEIVPPDGYHVEIIDGKQEIVKDQSLDEVFEGLGVSDIEEMLKDPELPQEMRSALEKAKQKAESR